MHKQEEKHSQQEQIQKGQRWQNYQRSTFKQLLQVCIRCFQSKRKSEPNEEKTGRFLKKNLLEVLEVTN